MLSIETGVLRNMVTTLWAQQALMPTGWCRDVRVEIDASGRIVAVETDAARPADGPSATMLDCLLPAPANLHSIGLSLLPVLYHQGGCDGRALGAGQRRFGNGLDRFAMLHDGAAKALSYLSDDAVLGVAPHSLRAVGPTELRELMAYHPSGPFHIHAAEQVAEVREVSDALSARPVQWLLDNAGVDERWCVIHATHLDDAEVAGLAGTKAVVGLCPITESSLGDGIFRGVRFLLDAVTAGGAQACGRDSGAIAVGQWADLVALDTGSTDLVGRIGDGVIDSAVFARGESAVAEVWSAGRHVVSGGVHREHARITARYRGVMKALMAKQ